MIVIEKDKYYIGFWYVEWDTGNWMGSAWTELDSDRTTWDGKFRFRYYRGGEVLFNSKDTKRWFELHVEGKTEWEVRETYQEAANRIAEANGAHTNEFVPMHGGTEAFKQIEWGKYPWWNQRIVDPQEHTDTPRQGGNND